MDLFPPKATIVYVVMVTPLTLANYTINLRLSSYLFFLIGSKSSNCVFFNRRPHPELLSPLLNRYTAQRDFSMKFPYLEVQSTSVLFFIVQAAVTPTRVFPAPHGNTIIPERARLITLIELIHSHTRYQTFYLEIFPDKHEVESKFSNQFSY